MAGCPVCENKEVYDWIYTLLICTRCRALLDATPFGVILVMKDAAKRYPEILQWWDDRFEQIEKYRFNHAQTNENKSR